MVTRYRFRDRPRSMRSIADADREKHDVSLGPSVATFAGKHHTVHIDQDGDIHVHRRTAQTHDKPTHSDLLKKLNEKNAELWRRKS